MAHRIEPCQHPRRQRAPLLALHTDLCREQFAELDQIQHVFENHGVVHRAEFEMRAVVENLLGEFRLQQSEPGPQPAIGFVTRKQTAGKHQRLGIGQKMIAEQMIFERGAENAHLRREALPRRRIEFVTRERPCDPVHDPQRGRIRLPTIARGRWIFQNPARHHVAMPWQSTGCAFGAQIVEIMQIVEPELGCIRPVPAGGVLQLAVLADESKSLRRQQAGQAAGAVAPHRWRRAQRRRRPIRRRH